MEQRVRWLHSSAVIDECLVTGESSEYTCSYRRGHDSRIQYWVFTRALSTPTGTTPHKAKHNDDHADYLNNNESVLCMRCEFCAAREVNVQYFRHFVQRSHCHRHNTRCCYHSSLRTRPKYWCSTQSSQGSNYPLEYRSMSRTQRSRSPQRS